MKECPKSYTTLFNAMTDVIAAIDRQDYGTARALAVRGQQDAEEIYLSETEEQTKNRQT